MCIDSDLSERAGFFVFERYNINEIQFIAICSIRSRRVKVKYMIYVYEINIM